MAATMAATSGEEQAGKATLGSRSILILYGTETGNSQEIAEHLGRMCLRLRFDTAVDELDDVKLRDLLHNHALVIFVISTTGQGQLPTNALSFWKSIRRAKLPPDCLALVKFTTFGLGDSSYSKFNWAARQLHSRLQRLGAREAFARGEADERHDNGIDSIYRPWYQDLKNHLLVEFPLPHSVQPIPDDVPLPPKYVLRLATNMDPSAEQSLDQVNPVTPKEDLMFQANREKSAVLSHIDNPRSRKEQYDLEWERTRGSLPILARKDEKSSEAVLGNRARADMLDKDNLLKDFHSKYLLETPPKGDETTPAPDLLPIPDSFVATVCVNERVTPPDHWQDVRLISMGVRHKNDDAALSVRPGSTVTIFPKNFDEDVHWLIKRMGWDKIADIPVEFALSSQRGGNRNKSTMGVMPRRLYPVPGTTLRDLLLHNLDIAAIPTRTFIEKVSQYAEDKTQKERLIELTRPENTQEFYDFSSRPRRTILELLQEFHSVSIPFEAVLDLFPIIRGREFSIANGGLDVNGEQDGIIALDILVALVEYKTIIRKPRQGLCSRYLKTLPVGTRMRIVIKHGESPPLGHAGAERPLVAIATGTGIAPIRSLIQDRNDWIETAPTLLFFGCRNKSADFHFEKEWESQSDVTVIPAFSRDPQPHYDPTLYPYGSSVAGNEGGMTHVNDLSTGMISYNYDEGKNYVQHLIRKHAAEVCRFLARDAIICICGNSGRMPESVRLALVDAAVLGGLCQNVAQAKRLFDERNPSGLAIWQETW